MTIHIYSLQELNKAAEKYCQKYCSLRDNEYCVLNAAFISGVICPLSFYLDKLETGELRK